ncbi:hypothetical protein [Vibrio campbellii]|uniref:hypothetical protein n=1 Tax=Vibrio campbellii TaxID=680 RepID=UPI00210D4E42|nr:hypothetical protein [Vibrio campbellii]
MSNDFKHLPKDVYLFGVDFPNVGDAQTPRYRAINIEKDLTSLEELKNICPMSRLPIAINLGEESAALWAKDDLGSGLLGLAIIGCNDQSQQSASPVSSSAQTEQEKHPVRVYVGKHNNYVMESVVTNENWVSDDKIKSMYGIFPKYYVFNSDE